MIIDAESFEKSGDYAQAIGIFNALLGSGFLNESEKRDLENRKRTIERTVNSKVSTLKGKSRLSSSRGDYQTALAHMLEAKAISPEDVTVSLEIKRLEKLAAAAREKAKRKKAVNTLALFETGLNHYKSENFDEAIKAWEQVLKAEPANLKAKDYINRAKTMRRLQQGG